MPYQPALLPCCLVVLFLEVTCNCCCLLLWRIFLSVTLSLTAVTFFHDPLPALQVVTGDGWASDIARFDRCLVWPQNDSMSFSEPTEPLIILSTRRPLFQTRFDGTVVAFFGSFIVIVGYARECMRPLER